VPDRVFMTSGLFFPESIVLHLARQRGIDVLTYEWGHLANSLVFAWNGPAGIDFDEGWERARDVPLSLMEQDAIRRFLDQRVGGEGAGDIAVYWPRMARDADVIQAQLGLDPLRPIVTLFSNILWDTALFERDRAFAGFRQFLNDTLALFRRWPEAQLVIRVHPAEVRLPLNLTRNSIQDHLRNVMPSLPSNIVVVGPESPISSYVLGQMSAASVVYASTIGLELAAMGKPVVVAGAVHYAGRGFTLDVPTREAYASILRTAMAQASLDPTSSALAMQYAHFFFLSAALPFPLIDKSSPGDVRLDPRFAQLLKEEEDASVGAICDALLHRLPVIAPRASAWSDAQPVDA
jgi:hypothetical protein